MSKSVKSWFGLLAVGAAEWVAFIAWMGYGIAPAGRVLSLWVWIISILYVLTLFTVPRGNIGPKSRIQTTIAIASDVAFIAALAWYGHVFIGVIYTIGTLSWIVSYCGYDADGNPIPIKRKGA